MKSIKEKIIARVGFQNKSTSEYIDSYYLESSEYENFWEPKINKIFDASRNTLIYQTNKESEVLYDGDLLFIQEIAKFSNDEYIIVAEQQAPYSKEPLLRFKYPISILWEQMNVKENGVSFAIFELSFGPFCVIGDSGKWGKSFVDMVGPNYLPYSAWFSTPELSEYAKSLTKQYLEF